MTRKKPEPRITVDLQGRFFDLVDFEQQTISDVRVTTSELPGWTIALDMTTDGLVYGLRVDVDDDNRRVLPITQVRLRSVRLGELALVARQVVMHTITDHADSIGLHPSPQMRAMAQQWSRPLSGKRAEAPAKDDYFYARVAKAFERAWREGTPPADINARVADWIGYAPTTVPRFKREAIEAGMLESNGRGLSGGRLTDKARAVLERKEGA